MLSPDILERLRENLPEKGCIVDIGCGDGDLLRSLTRHEYYLYGVDLFLPAEMRDDNGIKFLPLKIVEDGIWTLELLCLAERWLRIPTPFYVYRSNENSITGRKRSPEQLLKFWTNPLITGIDYLDKFMSRFEFFRQHPNYNVRVLNVVANECFKFMRKAFKELKPRELYEIFRLEFQNDKEHAALIAYLLFITNTYRNELFNK